MSRDKFVEFCDFVGRGAVSSNIMGYLRPQGEAIGEQFDVEKVDLLIAVATYFAGIVRSRPDLIKNVEEYLRPAFEAKIQSVHSEREAELEREIEAQGTKFEQQIAECRKKSADRDKLALQVDQLQARITLLSDAAGAAVNGLGNTLHDVLDAINGASEGEIRF